MSDRQAIESLRETGVHGGIERIPDPEDIDESEQQGNVPYPKDEWKPYYEPSGGSTAMDVDESDKDFRGEPTLKYSNEARGNKKSGGDWTRRLELDRVGYDSPLYDKLMDLSKVWIDPNTQITYVVAEQQGEDRLVFNNPKLKWRGKNQSDERGLTLTEMREVLKDSDINLSIARPRHESDRQFVNDLKHIRLGTGVLKGEKVRVEFSKPAQEKRKEDKNFFNLKLNRKALEKFTTPEERSNVEDFIGLLTHAGKDEIEWMGYEMRGGEITGVSLQERERDKVRNGEVVGKQGGPKEKITISATVFRAIMENVFPHKRGDRSTGFEFKVPGGMQESIHPGMSADQVAAVMKKVKIDGVSLPENVKFFIGNDFQK